jgi:hypothetical protein
VFTLASADPACDEHSSSAGRSGLHSGIQSSFRQLNLDVPVRLAAARTHFEPIANLGLQLPQRLFTRGSGNSNRPDTRTRVLCAPVAVSLGELTDKSHPFRG